MEDLGADEVPFGVFCGGPAALMVTEGVRRWSPLPEVVLVGVLPLSVFGPPTAGTAGGIATLPFTGELFSFLFSWADPTAGAVGLEEAEDCDGIFLVALA